MDLIASLRSLDPFPFLSGLFFILWVVEVKLGPRAQITRIQRMEERLHGYDMAVEQERESQRLLHERQQLLYAQDDPRTVYEDIERDALNRSQP